MKNGQVVQTLNKDVKLTVNILDGRVLFDSGKNELPEVSTADIDASNGVVHIIDGVIVTEEQQKKFLTMNATWPGNQPTEQPTEDEPAPQPNATPIDKTSNNKTPETNTLNLDSDTCGISIKTTLIVNVDESIESSTTTTYTKCDENEN